jgi:NAD(P)-dependent dehydrogenase (short-subunit alcohol dehydrogenase family)
MAPEQGPYIKAEEIATTIVFLASDSSLRINGAVVPIDNAWSTI